VAAPIFREMATYLLDYYRVPAAQPVAEAN